MTLEICHARCPTQTTDLIASLKKTDLGNREYAALTEIKKQMVREFCDNSKSLFTWQEACMLAEVATQTEFEDLVFAFSTAITDGIADHRPVNHELLRCFARCLRQSKHKIPCQRARLGTVLAGLNSHITTTTQTNDTETTYLLLCSIGTVLDAMVDIKFSDIDRESLHSPLKKALEGLAGSKEPRISQAAEYASQALARVPDNEGPWEEFFRISGTTIQAVAKISGGVAKLDPSQIFDAGPDLIHLLNFFATAAKGGKEIWDTRDDLKQMIKAMQDVSERKGWYDALRQTDILIRSKAYNGLQKVLPILKCLNKSPFWRGLYFQLERQWMSEKGQGDRKEVEQVIEWTLQEKALSDHWIKHDSVRCWIELVADSFHHPEWKDLPSKQKRRHRLSFWTRKNNFDPQLKTIPRETHLEECSSSQLLHKALASCRAARLFYADAILAQYYTNGSLLNIKRLPGDDVPMSRCYVNLSLVEYQNTKNGVRSSIVSLQQRLEAEAPKPGKVIVLPDLFNRRILRDKQLGKPRRILIRGRAGVGKTTLCKKITHDFLHNGLWSSDYDRIVWIPLRRLKDHASMEGFLEMEVFKRAANSDDMVKILEETLNKTDEDRSLFILDGLDEIIGFQRPGGSLIDSIWDLLNRKHVIITSRPHAALPQNVDSYDLEIETVGFRDKEVVSYVENVIPDSSQRIEIMNFINHHWAMKGLMRIPIQLDAFCFTWSEPLSNEKPLTTMTGLYSRIEIKLHHKDMVRMGKTIDGKPLSEHTAASFKTHRQVYKVMKAPIDVVRFMAFFGMYHSVTEFTSEMRGNIHDAVGGTTDYDLDNISFLRTSDSSITHRDQDYYFLHLTFQEYFAAQHFVKCWKDGRKIPTMSRKSAKLLEIDPADLLAQEKYNGRYNIMWRFVTGILESEDDEEEEHLVKFLKQIGEEPLDLLGPTHLRFLMHCFSEVSELEKNRKLIQIWKDMSIQLSFLLLSDFNKQSSMYSGQIGLEMEFPERILFSVLEDGDLGQKELVATMIPNRQYLSPKICHAVVQSFRHIEIGHVGVRSTFVRVIGMRHEFQPEVVIEVLRELESDTDLVCNLLLGLRFRQSVPKVPGVVLEEILFSTTGQDDRVLEQRADLFALQSHLPETILQEMLLGLGADSAVERSRAIRSLAKSSLSHEDVLGRVIGEFNARIGTDTEARLRFLQVRYQPTLPVEALRTITERVQDMTATEILNVVNILEYHQPLEPGIIIRIWAVLELENADIRTCNRVCEILRQHANYSDLEGEFLTRFMSSQQKDKFSVVVANNCFKKGFCPPIPILDHVLSLVITIPSNTPIVSTLPTGNSDGFFIEDVFMHNPLPNRALKTLWLIYDKLPSYISEVLGFQTSLPDNIVSNLVARLRVSMASGLDTKNYLTALQGQEVPDDIIKHALDVLLSHGHEDSEDVPLHLLNLLIGQDRLSPGISSSVATWILRRGHLRNWGGLGKLERLCEKHGGLEKALMESDSDLWVNLLEALLMESSRATMFCFVRQNCLHIKMNEVSVQVSIEADEQRQKLQAAIDHIHEVIRHPIGASASVDKILDRIENLSFEPAGCDGGLMC